MKENVASVLWDRLAERSGTPFWASFGKKASVILAAKYAVLIRDASGWYESVLAPYLLRLREADADIRGIAAEERNADGAGTLARIEELFTRVLMPLKTYLAVKRGLAEIDAWQDGVKSALTRWAAVSPLGRSMSDTVLSDPAVWQRGFERLVQLTNDRPAYEERSKLLLKLRTKAPGWADAVMAGVSAARSMRPVAVFTTTSVRSCIGRMKKPFLHPERMANGRPFVAVAEDVS